MRNYFFFNVMRRTIIQFFDAFNDIKIARYSDSGNTIDRWIKVPIKHSVKEKVYYWLQDGERKDDEILPMITAYMSSIDYATDRKVNSAHVFTANCDNIQDGSVQTFLHPCPYNLTFTMNIWALHMTDIDQIMEQILPFFCPHIYVRVHLEVPDIDFDVKIVFRSATPEISHEMSDIDYRVINYSLDFEVQTWFFKPLSDTTLIHKIYGSYATDPMTFRKQVNDTTSTFTSAGSGSPAPTTFEVKGRIDDDGEEIIKYNLFDPYGRELPDVEV